MPRLTVSIGRLALVLLCSACADTARDQTEKTVISLRLTPIDSIRLVESDTALLTFPTTLFLRGSGELLVGDATSGRVLQFDSLGAFTGVIGRRGQGPGEFIVPGAIVAFGDSSVAVSDWQNERLSLFSGAGLRFVRAMGATALIYSMTSRDDTLLLGMFGRGRYSRNAALLPGADSLIRSGGVPKSYHDSPMIRTVHPYFSVAIAGTHLVTGFTGSNVVVDSVRGSPAVAFVIPAERRRPMPHDMVRRFEKEKAITDSVIAAMGSTLVGLYAMSDSLIAAVHLDVTLNGQLVTADGWLSVVDLESKAACVDLPFAASDAGKPIFGARGDTLLILEQRIGGQTQAETWLRRLLIDTKDCRWVPLEELTEPSDSLVPELPARG